MERSRSRNTLQNIVNLKLFNSKEEKEKVNKYLDLKWKAESNLYKESETKSIQMELSEFEKQIERKIQIHEFNKKVIDLNLFNNIANGIVLIGFLEVKK